MEITVDLPDDVAKDLQSRWTDLPRGILEAIALEGYRSGELTHAQVQRMLGFETRMEVDGFLKENGSYLHYTEADLEEDLEALRDL